MSVLAQAFLTLVRSHLMSLMLLSVRHNMNNLKGFLFAHFRDERLGGLESRHVVSGDHDGGILGNVASRLLCTCLYREAAEAAKIDILSVGQGVLDAFHEVLNNALHFDFLNASALSDLIYDFSFSHDIFLFYF